MIFPWIANDGRGGRLIHEMKLDGISKVIAQRLHVEDFYSRVQKWQNYITHDAGYIDVALVALGLWWLLGSCGSWALVALRCCCVFVLVLRLVLLRAFAGASACFCLRLRVFAA